MDNNDGYWYGDSLGNYHWVDSTSAGVGGIIVFAMLFMNNMAETIYSWLSLGNMLIVSGILTFLFLLVNRFKFSPIYIIYFIQFMLALLMMKLIAAEYAFYGGNGIGSIANMLICTFIIGLIVMVVYKLAFSFMFLSGIDYNIKDSLKALIIQAVGTGIFYFFDILS